MKHNKRWLDFLNANPDVRDFFACKDFDDVQSYNYFQNIVKQQKVSCVETMITTFAFVVGYIPASFVKNGKESLYDLLRQKEIMAFEALKKEADLFHKEMLLDRSLDDAVVSEQQKAKKTPPIVIPAGRTLH